MSYLIVIDEEDRMTAAQGIEISAPPQNRDSAIRLDLPRSQWTVAEWAALERFMGECWDARVRDAR